MCLPIPTPEWNYPMYHNCNIYLSYTRLSGEYLDSHDSDGSRNFSFGGTNGRVFLLEG